MSNILQRVKSRVNEEEAPIVTPVYKPNYAPVESQEVVMQTVLEPTVIKQNNPGVPLHGFTLQVLANELGLLLEAAMHKANITSVSAEALGIFNMAGVTPKGFKRELDPYTDQVFYVLKTANRMSEVFKNIVSVLNKSNSEIISFPYLTESTLTLPVKYINSKEDFEHIEVKVKSLYLNRFEINALNYKFIKEIQFCKANPDIQGSIDLIAMKIDRAEWRAAPYRTANDD